MATRLRVYASTETHTWIQKAADLFGIGTDAIRWIAVDEQQRMDVAALDRQIAADVANGELPFLVVGTAGSVGTGVVDPLAEMARVCRRHHVWFHVDGAYGALAAQVEGAPEACWLSATQIPWRSIRTSGYTRRSKPAAPS